MNLTKPFDFSLGARPCKVRTGNMLAPSTNAAQLEDSKERKAIMIESNKAMVTKADFCNGILIGLCFIRH